MIDQYNLRHTHNCTDLLEKNHENYSLIRAETWSIGTTALTCHPTHSSNTGCWPPNSLVQIATPSCDVEDFFYFHQGMITLDAVCTNHTTIGEAVYSVNTANYTL